MEKSNNHAASEDAAMEMEQSSRKGRIHVTVGRSLPASASNCGGNLFAKGDINPCQVGEKIHMANTISLDQGHPNGRGFTIIQLETNC